MKKILSALLVLVMAFSLTACGSKSPIVGTWHTWVAGIKTTYVFESNGTYTVTNEGWTNSSGQGRYSYDQQKGTITFTTENGKVTTDQLEFLGCCMIMTSSQYNVDVVYGRVYEEREKAPLLEDILGVWEYYHATYHIDATIEFRKDGTYTLTYNTSDTGIYITSDTGIYIYNPIEKTITLPGADVELKLTEGENGYILEDWSNGLVFKK